MECECVLYDQFSHGYLNIGDVVKDCQPILEESIEHLAGMMGVERVALSKIAQSKMASSKVAGSKV